MKAISEKWYTARELAATFGCSVSTIANHANKLFGKGKKGVTRCFDEAQITLLLESIKQVKQAGGRRTLTSDVKAERADERDTSQTVWEVDLSKRLAKGATSLTPILRLKLIQEQKDRLRDEECAIYRSEIKRLEELSARQAAWIDDALKANTQLWSIAESAGALITDREDILALYRR
ncbi:MAG: hypothetical protein LBK00_00495 [Treponema sp.]|jgi:hypothetical protein|nr:hypothetical protein [Treponema sp.]